MDEGLKCKVSTFSDDSKTTGRVHTITLKTNKQQKKQLQSDDDRLVYWSNKWQMEF